MFDDDATHHESHAVVPPILIDSEPAFNDAATVTSRRIALPAKIKLVQPKASTLDAILGVVIVVCLVGAVVLLIVNYFIAHSILMLASTVLFAIATLILLRAHRSMSPRGAWNVNSRRVGQSTG